MFAVWIFALGLLAVPVLPDFIPLTLLLALAGLLMVWRTKVVSDHAWRRYAVCFVLGLLVSSWQLQSLCQAQLAHDFDNTWQTIRFKIVGIPQQRELASVFLADVQDVYCPESACPDISGGRVRLSWHRPPQPVEPGQVWSAKTKLKRPRGFANPSGFDFQAWLLGQSIVATGYVHSEASLHTKRFVWAQVRKSVGDQVAAAAGESDYTRFWRALLVADRAAIDAADWHVLQATGTVHLVAISGLHIGLVSLWAFWLGRLLGRFWCLLANNSAALVMHWLPPLLSCSAALLYAALAGFSIPTVRAFTACLLINLCWLLGLRLPPLTLLGIGVAAVVLGEPLAGQNHGFWLSFAAVFLLIHALCGRITQRRLVTSVWLQVILSLGLSVPLLWLGQGVSWVSPVANLVAVPVVSFLIVPGLFVAAFISTISLPLAYHLLLFLDWIFDALWQYLLWLQAAPSALLWAPKVLSGVALGIAFAGLLLLLAPAGMRLRGLGMVSLGLAMAIRPPPQPQLRMTIMDVGQGLSVVVQTPSETWVYDTGPRFSDTFDAGSRIVAPYLRAHGTKEISLTVSHADNDHSGGASALVGLFYVASLVVGERLSLPEDSALLSQQFCMRGQRWPLGTANAYVLWPPSDNHYEGNDASCVVLLQMPLDAQPGSSLKPKMLNILFTGDIDRSIEHELLALSPPMLPADIDVLIAPHHGSKSGSSWRFVRALNPKTVVFSAGYKNRYGHPHPDVVARFQAQGAKLYNTATSGAVVFEWRDGIAKITETRVAEAKLWYR